MDLGKNITVTSIVDDYDYRAILDLVMCSDPWPVDGGNQEKILVMIDRMGKARGFTDWVEAYHKL